MDPLEQPNTAAWQKTNVTRGNVLTLSTSGANCVALIEVDGAYRILHSDDDGQAWSAPWPEIQGNPLVTALLAGPIAVHVGLLMEGVVRAYYPLGGAFSGWMDTNAGLPDEAVVISLAQADDVLYAGTQRHNIFARSAIGPTAGRWNTMGSVAASGDALEAVTSLVPGGGRLVCATARGLFLMDEKGDRLLLDSYAPAAPTGLVRVGEKGLMAWSPHAVRLSENSGAVWVGLPDPPRSAFVRSTATAGPIVLAVMESEQGSSIHGWRYGVNEWTPFDEGLPQPASPSIVAASATSFLLGLRNRGIYRLPVCSDEHIIPAAVLTLEDEQTLQAGTSIRFTIQRPEDVRIELRGPGGECIREIDLEGLRAGSHEVSIADDSIVPGIYTFTIRTHGLTRAGRRLILL